MQDKNNGVIGCLDPNGRFAGDLAAWARRGGASIAYEGEGLGLWAWPSADARHHLQTESLRGLLIGEVFEIEATPGRTAITVDLSKELANAYRAVGPDFTRRWVGQFSLILLDLAQRRVLLYRDATGAKSLYYSVGPGGGIAFSDRLDLLIASPVVEKRLSRTALHEYLRFLDVSAPNTIYDKVLATEPGALYLFDEQGIEVQQPVVPPDRGLEPQSVVTAVEELDRRLKHAVAKRAGDSGAIVVFLSGGVDSAVLCAIAAQLREVRLQALTVGFEEGPLDETPVAKAIAAHLQIPHRVISFPMVSYRKAFDDLTGGIEYPVADPAAIPTLLAFRHAREMGPVALEGTGADGLFGSLPPRHQRWAIEYGARLPKTMRRHVARLMKSLPVLRGYAPLVDFEEPEQVLIRWRGWTRLEIEHLCNEAVSFDHTRFYEVFRSYPRRQHFERYSALLRSMPDDRLHQTAMLTGLKVYFPYQDPAVRNYVFGLHADLLYRTGESKRVLKAVLEQYIPRPIWNVPKHSFDFPFLDLMAADNYALVRAYLDPALTSHWGLFDRKRLNSVVDAFVRGERTSPFGDRSQAFRIWTLVVLFAWLENHYRNL